MRNKLMRALLHPRKIVVYLIEKNMFRIIPDKKFIKLKYRFETQQKLDLDDPQTFGEKIQWLKLYDRQDRYTYLVDKYKVRNYVKNIIGEEYLIPLLGVYNSFNDIDFNKLPNKFVLKPNHTSGNVFLCESKKNIDKQVLEKEINSWLKREYYWAHREWPYKNIEPKIVCEEFLNNNEMGNITDYKFYCFNGEPKYCQIIKGRNFDETIDFYDMDWNRMSFTGLRNIGNSKEGIEKPEKLQELIKLAKTLSEEIPFVRVDFYYVEDKIYFGEITFYPQSGYGSFYPEKWNKKIGDLIKLPK